ncbi:MAG: hypothetical protein HYX27_10680 [Acidobacteria bacterium]|nr:hypothetical protein [Acidobacteriota bacterium]
MAGRGAQTFNKRQKEQQRKERQQEKFAKRLERKKQSEAGQAPSDEIELGDMSIHQADPSENAPEAAAPQAVLREPARDAEPR